MSTAGPRYSSLFHQYDGQDVLQHAHRIHSYIPSSLRRSSLDCRTSLPCAECQCWSPNRIVHVTYVFGKRITLQVWLDGLVLLVELRQIRNKVLDNICVWQWIYPRLLCSVCRNSACSPHVSRCQSYGLPQRNSQRHANVFTPSMFMAQLPQIPSLHDLRNVRVGSTSFLILIRASNIIGPVLFKSNV